MEGSSQHVAAAFMDVGARRDSNIGLADAHRSSQGGVSAAERRRPFDDYRTGGIGSGEVMARLADAIDAHGASMRNRYQRLLTDPTELDARLAEGEQHARQRADPTLGRTMIAMGL
jgi:hypothetical protein